MENIAVLYEVPDFLVIAKPAGMLVHPIQKKTEDEKTNKTVTGWLRIHYPEVSSVGDDPELRPGIVHRLDRDTSGVMLVARNAKAFDYLKHLFQKHEIKKSYRALVWGHVKEREGTIKLPIGRKTGTTRRTVHKTTAPAKDAITHYRVISRFMFENSEVTLLSVEPKTGRTHQIRVHLHSLGYSIVGDTLYGGKAQLEKSEAMGIHRQFLHAESIEFTGLDGIRLTVSADLPEDLSRVLEKLLPVPADLHSHS
jgi:23S rRNA pseudouridine1911/1915/1917 synthase